jgi:formate dehydrogenase (NADP+) beta subunit
VPGIYACGDIAEGAKLFINAVASGQKAANSIDEFIRQKEIIEDISGTMTLPRTHTMTEGYVQLQRENPPVEEADKRANSTEAIEFNYPDKAAREQGTRCLKCHINTIFNGARCIMCNGCVDVCPTHCLKLVSLTELEMNPQLESVINHCYEITLSDYPKEEQAEFLNELGSVMLKNEEKCIRCGYCAKRCPTDAVTMEWFSFEQNYRYED